MSLSLFRRLVNVLPIRGPPSPASDLPVEILLEIFKHCRPDTICRRLDQGSPSMMPEGKEFAALYVNRHWRSVALTCPVPIYLQLYLPSDKEDAVCARRNNMILSRLRGFLLNTPGDAPLSFHIHHWITDSSLVEPVPIKILELLCAHSERWQDVSMALLPSTYIGIHHAMRGPFPRLASLSLQDTDSFQMLLLLQLREQGLFNVLPDVGTLTRTLPSFANAPLLRTVSVFFRGGQPGPGMRIPWRQLTKLTVKYPNPRTFLSMLKSCPNLREFVIEDYNRTTISWTRPTIPFEHSALRVIHFKSANISHFLPLVHAPRLEEVHSDSAIFSTADIEALALPSLQAIHLRFVFFNEKDARERLPLLRVPELSVDLLGDMPAGTFDILAANPVLETLRVKFDKTGDEEGLKRLVDRAAGSRLSSLHVEAKLSGEMTEFLRARADQPGVAISGLNRCEELAELARRPGSWSIRSLVSS